MQRLYLFEYYDYDGFKYGESHKGGICWHKNNGITTEYYQNEYGGRRTLAIVWLPRQDQLQEMIIEKTPRYNNLTVLNNVFYYHAVSFMHKRHNIFTMEQMWLCLLMEKIYNKIWDGKQWINLNKK